MIYIKRSFLFLVVLMIMNINIQCVADEGKYFISLYGGRATERKFLEVARFCFTDFIDSNIIVVSAGKKLTGYKDLLRLEAEGQIAKHWRYQKHWEINAVLILRWLKFPWDKYIDTSFALGDGISYATEDPKVEVDEIGWTSKMLNYLMLEWEFSVPDQHKWSVFMRNHHRSGIYGLIDDISGGTNIVTGGIRYYF